MERAAPDTSSRPLGRVAVIGAGSWGTTVAAIAARRAPTVLWVRRAELAAAIAGSHENADYLPGIALPETLETTSSLADAVADASLVVMAVPSHGFRAVLEQLAGHIGDGVAVLSLTKGLESGTYRRMTELVAEIVPGAPRGVLSGPNLAAEVAAGQPAATVVAMTVPGDPADDAGEADRWATAVQELLRTDRFRVYTNPDLTGCEVAGATKNVLALAAGMADGLGMGDSTRAALITRGLAELGRLGVALGGHYLTFGGLAGVGDLVATCTSARSRNRTVGFRLGQGESLDTILGGMQMVAEGVKSARPLLELAAAHDIEMPIGAQVAAVIEGHSSPADAIPALMSRSAKPEFHWMSDGRGRPR